MAELFCRNQHADSQAALDTDRILQGAPVSSGQGLSHTQPSRLGLHPTPWGLKLSGKWADLMEPPFRASVMTCCAVRQASSNACPRGGRSKCQQYCFLWQCY